MKTKLGTVLSRSCKGVSPNSWLIFIWSNSMPTLERWLSICCAICWLSIEYARWGL